MPRFLGPLLASNFGPWPALLPPLRGPDLDAGLPLFFPPGLKFLPDEESERESGSERSWKTDWLGPFFGCPRRLAGAFRELFRWLERALMAADFASRFARDAERPPSDGIE